jgi:predicted phage-related endonuclease
MNREQWLAERNHAVGASEVGAIIDLYYPPNAEKGEELIETRFNAFDVFLRKTGRSLDEPPSRAMEWGNIVEDAIAKEYALRTGHGLQRCQFVRFQHPQFPLSGTPDYLITDEPGGLECKNVGQWSALRIADGQIPHCFRFQCQAYLMVKPEREWWDVACCLHGNPVDPVRVLPNPNLQGVIAECVSRFWKDHVEADKAPVCDHLIPTHDQVKRLYVRGTGPSITATPEIEDQMCVYMDWKKQEKALKDGLEKSRVAIELFMAENTACVGNRCEATWKNNKDADHFDDQGYISALETKLYDEFGVVADDLRRIRTQFQTVTAGARVLRVKEIKTNGK